MHINRTCIAAILEEPPQIHANIRASLMKLVHTVQILRPYSSNSLSRFLGSKNAQGSAMHQSTYPQWWSRLPKCLFSWWKMLKHTSLLVFSHHAMLGCVTESRKFIGCSANVEPNLDDFMYKCIIHNENNIIVCV